MGPGARILAKFRKVMPANYISCRAFYHPHILSGQGLYIQDYTRAGKRGTAAIVVDQTAYAEPASPIASDEYCNQRPSWVLMSAVWPLKWFQQLPECLHGRVGLGHVNGVNHPAPETLFAVSQ